MAMSIPSWLYYLFGGTMLAVAAYEFGLLALGVVTGRSAGRDVEISHIFMGISMAGMFVGQWAFGKNTVWEIIFGLLLIWFVAASNSVGSSVRPSSATCVDPRRHELCHVADVLVSNGWFDRFGIHVDGHVHVVHGRPSGPGLVSCSR